MQTDYSNYFTNLHRMIDRVSGATKFTGVSSYHLRSTVNFPDFISIGIRGSKIKKNHQAINQDNFHRELYKEYGSQKFTRS